MSEQKNTREQIEALVTKMQDLQNSIVAVVEKMGTIQLEALDGGFKELSESLDSAFSHSSNAAEAVGEVLHAAEQVKKEQQANQD